MARIRDGDEVDVGEANENGVAQGEVVPCQANGRVNPYQALGEVV